MDDSFEAGLNRLDDALSRLEQMSSTLSQLKNENVLLRDEVSRLTQEYHGLKQKIEQVTSFHSEKEDVQQKAFQRLHHAVGLLRDVVND